MRFRGKIIAFGLVVVALVLGILLYIFTFFWLPKTGEGYFQTVNTGIMENGVLKVEFGNVRGRYLYGYNKTGARYVLLGIRKENGLPGWVKIYADGPAAVKLAGRVFGEYIRVEYIKRTVKSQDLTEYQEICIRDGQKTPFCTKLDMAAENKRWLFITGVYEN